MYHFYDSKLPFADSSCCFSICQLACVQGTNQAYFTECLGHSCKKRFTESMISVYQSRYTYDAAIYIIDEVEKWASGMSISIWINWILLQV